MNLILEQVLVTSRNSTQLKKPRFDEHKKKTIHVVCNYVVLRDGGGFIENMSHLMTVVDLA